MEVKTINDMIILKIVNNRATLVDGSSFDIWFESGDGKMKQILITYNPVAINSIQIVYEQNGRPKLASRHGGNGDSFYAIGLGSNEHITSVRGHFGVINTCDYCAVIRSLCFTSNVRSFGPFGREVGTPFTFDLTSGGRLVGFHGRSNSKYLTDFGIYLDISNLRTFQYPKEPSVKPI